MMIVWLKFVHVAAIAIWCAGLICLPSLYLQRAPLPEGEELHRLQRFVRFSYVALISPAAYVAIVSGIALVFVAGTFVAWFSLKLFFVGMLVGIHILTGLGIVRLFEAGEVYPVWLFIAITAATVLVVLAILFLVLGKPSLDIGVLPEQIFEPGALRRIMLDIIPWTTP